MSRCHLRAALAFSLTLFPLAGWAAETPRNLFEDPCFEMGGSGPWRMDKGKGTAAAFKVDDADAFEGKRSALVTIEATGDWGVQFGQIAPGGQAGKTYTFAAFVKSVGEPTQVQLEIERSAKPWDRAVRTEKIAITKGKWTELHTTFKVEKPFAEGWFAYVSSAQEGGRLWLDGFRLHEGRYVPGKLPEGARNLFTNPGFEAGQEPWSFSYHEQYNVRRTYRRASFLVTRLLANLGAAGETPLLDRFRSPAGAGEKRWLEGFYLDEPEEWDDPYRFFRW